MCHCRPLAEPLAKRGKLELSLSLQPPGMVIYRNQPLSVGLVADKFLDSQSARALGNKKKLISNQLAAKVAGSIGLTEV